MKKDNITKLFHDLANEGDQARLPPECDIMGRIEILKGILQRRKQAVRDMADVERDIALQRDQLLARIANVLGIPRADFKDFLDSIDNQD